MQEALTRRSSWLTLAARCECLKRHGVGEREGELGADFSSIVLPRLFLAAAHPTVGQTVAEYATSFSRSRVTVLYLN